VSGQQGVEKGEMWLDTTGGTYVLKIYDGSAWRSESGTFVDVSGDTMTGALLLDNAASASAPDLSFDGDANTGIYSPGADEVAIATGGVGRLFVDSNGDVKIEDASADSSAGPEFSLYRNSASPADGDYLGQIRFDGENDTGGKKLYAKITGKTSDVTNGTEDGLIETAVIKAGSQTIVSRQTGTDLKLINGTGLQVDGNVGIGTTSASKVLTVTNADPVIRFEDTGGGAVNLDANSGSFVIDADPVNATGSTTIQFKADGAERMRIDSSGNVGIGTTSPGSKLEVNGQLTLSNSNSTNSIVCATGTFGTIWKKDAQAASGDVVGRLGVYHGSTTENSTIRFHRGGGATGGFMSFTSNNGSERMRIDGSGRLLVGTDTSTQYTSTTSSIQLTSTSSSNNPRIQVRANATTDASSIDFGGGAQRHASIGGSEGAFVVLTNSSAGAANVLERMRIDSSGNVGVGTSSPSNLLTVVGPSSANNTLALFTASNSNNTIAVTRTAGSDSYIALRAQSNIAYLDVGPSFGINTTASDGTSPAPRIRINSDGNVGIGTSSPSANLQIAATAVDSDIFAIRRQDSATNNLFRFFQDSTISGGTGGAHLNTANRSLAITASSAGNAADGIFVETTGNVGIGVTAPSEKLDINVSSTLGFSIGDDPADSTKLALRSYQGSTNNNVRSISYIGSDHRFQVGAVTGTTASEALRIDSSGNVGIGTTSPSVPLHVATGLAGDEVARLTNAGGFGLRIIPQVDGAVTAIRVAGGEGLRFDTNATEAVRIDSSGRLLVGTSSNSGGALLQVETGHIRVGSVSIKTAKATGIVSASGNQVRLIEGLGTSGELIAVTGAFSGQAVNETATMPTSGTSILRDYGDIQLFLSTSSNGSLFIKRDAGSGGVDVVLTVQS